MLVAAQHKSSLAVSSWWDAAVGTPSVCIGDHLQDAPEQMCVVNTDISLRPDGVCACGGLMGLMDCMRRRCCVFFGKCDSSELAAYAAIMVNDRRGVVYPEPRQMVSGS